MVLEPLASLVLNAVETGVITPGVTSLDEVEGILDNEHYTFEGKLKTLFP